MTGFVDEAASFLTPLRHTRFSRRRLQPEGVTQAITLIGDGHAIDTLLDPLELPVTATTEDTPIFATGISRAVREAGARGDLVLARIPRRLPMPRLGPRLPEMVGATAQVDAILDNKRGRESTLKQTMRIIRSSHFRARNSTDPADFDRFYDQFYLPFAQARFGNRALVRPRSALRKRFGRGFVTFIDGCDGCVAANLEERSGTILRLLSFGSPLDLVEVRKQRLQAVTHGLSARIARDIGCTAMDFGGSAPLITDGALYSKLRWTCRLTQQRYMRWDVLLHWQEIQTPVQRLLDQGPIFRSGNNGYQLVVGTGGQLPSVVLENRNLGPVWVSDSASSLPVNPKDWPLEPTSLADSTAFMETVRKSDRAGSR